MSTTPKKYTTPFYWVLIFQVFVLGASQAETKDISRRVILGGVVGNWQPHSLNDEPRFSGFGAAGATPFLGLYFTIPSGRDTGFRLSVGYWSLRDLKKIETVHSLTLHPVCLDLKYWLVPDTRLSAYVLYGGGVVFGVENETSPFGEKIHLDRAGWGVNLGAGFDLALSRRFGLGVLFQYHFVRFNRPLGGVDDFSGPKIAGEFTLFL